MTLPMEIDIFEEKKSFHAHFLSQNDYFSYNIFVTERGWGWERGDIEKVRNKDITKIVSGWIPPLPREMKN